MPSKGKSKAGKTIGVIAIAGTLLTGILKSGDIAEAVENMLKLGGRRGPDIEIVQVGFTPKGLIDVTVHNKTDRQVLISRLELAVLRDFGYEVSPVLPPTATYRVPVHSLREGEKRAVAIQHIVPATQFDRFLIDVRTPRVLQIEVGLVTSENERVRGEVRLW